MSIGVDVFGLQTTTFFHSTFRFFPAAGGISDGRKATLQGTAQRLEKEQEAEEELDE
jgi:hypothetical protein